MVAPGCELWTRRHAWVISRPMKTREPERQYGLSLMQVLTPFLILGATYLAGVIILTIR